MIRNKIFLSLLLSLSLIGCATTEPVVRVEIQRVEIPVPMPCAAKIPEKPNFSFPNLSESDDIYDKTKSLLSDRKLHLSYEEELLAELKSCL